MTPQIRLKTEGFRAVNFADIVLNGITVVSGENGCGKSTLSKLLYYSYKSALNFEFLVSRELRHNLRNIERFLEIVVSDIHSLSSRRNTKEEFMELRELRTNSNRLSEDEMLKWISFIERVANNYRSQPALFDDEKPFVSRKNERLKFIIKDILKINDISNDDNVPFKKVSDFLKTIYSDSLEKIKSRPTSLLLQELSTLYSQGDLPKNFEVFEFEEQIVSLKKDSLSIPYLIQNTIYIDTPMMFGVEHSNNEYWEDLNELLVKSEKNKFSKISSTISDEIINGDASVSENSFSNNEFVFKRSDGEIYNLIECATGVKAFAILQLLINNGCLTDKTLLIIDEPESNLHPQWIIEYARIIVLLNKEMGVKFFLASHNPDMVSAIKYISQKEGIDSNLNFYLAEKSSESSYTYNYKDLGVDIDPIFASFNIAIDRINQYGI